MNNRFLTIVSLLASSTLFMAGCDSDNSSFETPNTDLTPNNGTVSYNNFTILAENLQPEIFATPTENTFTFTELQITVRIGDRNNNVLTDEHEVFFKTEWGLMQSPSCKTIDGTCSVTWQTGSADDAPADHKNTIIAYTLGEESFEDANGNGIFDDNDFVFTDIEEPFVDSNRNGIYDSGEPIIDRPNGNDLTGANGVHDIGDTFFNGGGCTHSSLCSTTINTISIWDDVQLSMDGPPPATNTFTIGGTISFVTASQSITIQNNLGDDLTLTNADTNFTFATAIADGAAYDVTEFAAPAAGSCTFTNNSGNVTGANVTNVDIACP